MTTAVATIEQAIERAQEAGDHRAANVLYAKSLELIAAQQAGRRVVVDGRVVQGTEGETRNIAGEHAWGEALAELDQLWPEDARELRAAWGDNGPKNFALVRRLEEKAPGFMRDFASISERYGFADHPMFFELGASLARHSGFDVSRSAPARGADVPPPSAGTGGSAPRVADFLRGEMDLDKIREHISAAMDRGETTKANAWYALEQQAIAKLKGNGRIVDGYRVA